MLPRLPREMNGHGNRKSLLWESCRKWIVRLTVSSLEGIDSSRANLGDGRLYTVGKYSAGANAYGLQDLVRGVRQLTNDVYMSGSYRYIMMKGGSYFKPSSSWWYVQGGGRELYYPQMLLRVSEGFERNATVGFRCVREQSVIDSRESGVVESRRYSWAFREMSDNGISLVSFVADFFGHKGHEGAQRTRTCEFVNLLKDNNE